MMGLKIRYPKDERVRLPLSAPLTTIQLLSTLMTPSSVVFQKSVVGAFTITVLVITRGRRHRQHAAPESLERRLGPHGFRGRATALLQRAEDIFSSPRNWRKSDCLNN
jgi:hypothetical protein